MSRSAPTVLPASCPRCRHPSVNPSSRKPNALLRTLPGAPRDAGLEQVEHLVQEGQAAGISDRGCEGVGDVFPWTPTATASSSEPFSWSARWCSAARRPLPHELGARPRAGRPFRHAAKAAPEHQTTGWMTNNSRATAAFAGNSAAARDDAGRRLVDGSREPRPEHAAGLRETAAALACHIAGLDARATLRLAKRPFIASLPRGAGVCSPCGRLPDPRLAEHQVYEGRASFERPHAEQARAASRWARRHGPERSVRP
jgi:hypothetical protein